MHELTSIKTRSPEDTDRLAWAIASLLGPGDVVALIGPLGAGKTRFTQALFKAWGAEDYVRSPSFTLVNEYEGKLPLVHMDLYRINQPPDIEDLGYEEYFYGKGIVVVEWADRAEDYLPDDHIRLVFEKIPGEPEARIIHILRTGPKSQRLASEVSRIWRSLP